MRTALASELTWPEWTPASGALSSPREASAEKGAILRDVRTAGIVGALRAEFG